MPSRHDEGIPSKYLPHDEFITYFPRSRPLPAAKARQSELAMSEKTVVETTSAGGDNHGGSHPWPWKLTIASSSDLGDNARPSQIAGDVFPPSARNLPVLIRELIGHPCRLLTPSTVVTEELNPNRINILVDEHNVITDIRYG
ncbi:hypothetical protein E1956_41635 [Paraburkholderia pallida]|uniref:Peptidase inhibitor I78 family protein n=1 Tax=Paraburkholderia pallida TaxID=2547399 RepID=A0A4P7D4D4_9BURK|nr:hypothetical protein E1956_41635 [Paraburkholderia pallida]